MPTEAMEAGADINNIGRSEVMRQISPTDSKTTQIISSEDGGECFFNGIIPGQQPGILSRFSSTMTSTSEGQEHVNIYENVLSPRERMLKVSELFRLMDKNADMVIDWHEFRQHVTRKSGLNDDEALNLFKKVDTNSSGRISLNELDSYIARDRFLGIAGKDKVITRKQWKQFCDRRNMSPKKGDKIWKKMDADRSGLVTYREFDDYANRELTQGVLDKLWRSNG